MSDVLKGLTVTLALASIKVGQATEAKVIASIESDDELIDTDYPVIWSSSNPAVASVSPAGSVVGFAAGTVTITATSGTVKGSAIVTVTGLPFVVVADATAQAMIDNLPSGAQFELRFPTATFICQKDVP